MKKITHLTFLIVVLLLVIVFVSFGQNNNTTMSASKSITGTVSKKPLFEVFTSSTCIPCAAFVPGIDEVLNNNPGQYSVIKYQMNWPVPGDIYYTEQSGVRRDYYDVSAIPELFASGIFENASGFDQGDFEEYTMDSTDLEIECSAIIDEAFDINIDVNLEAYGDYEAGLITHIVVVEKTTVNNTGTNGEVQFHDVMMVMLPSAQGTVLEALSAGSLVNISETFDMTQTFMEQPTDLKLIVFVQDDTDQSVIQSEMVDVDYTFNAYSASFTITDYLGNPIDNAEIYLSDVGLTHTESSGQAQYNELLPGIYHYEIGASGAYPTSGTIEIINEDIIVDVILEIPVALIYENFMYNIPDVWTTIKVYPNYCSWESGRVKMGRRLGNLDEDILLISPAIDMSQAGLLTFELGEVTGEVSMIVGTVDDPEAPENFIEYTTIEATTGWEEVAFDFTEYTLEDSFLAFKFSGGQYTECYLDNILLEYNSTEVLESSKSDVEIFPNPVRDVLKIELNSKAEVNLYNSNGKFIWYRNVGEGATQMDFSNEVPGIYYMLLYIEQDILTKKIIVY